MSSSHPEEDSMDTAISTISTSNPNPNPNPNPTRRLATPPIFRDQELRDTGAVGNSRSKSHDPLVPPPFPPLALPPSAQSQTPRHPVQIRFQDRAVPVSALSSTSAAESRSLAAGAEDGDRLAGEVILATARANDSNHRQSLDQRSSPRDQTTASGYTAHSRETKAPRSEEGPLKAMPIIWPSSLSSTTPSRRMSGHASSSRMFAHSATPSLPNRDLRRIHKPTRAAASKAMDAIRSENLSWAMERMNVIDMKEPGVVKADVSMDTGSRRGRDKNGNVEMADEKQINQAERWRRQRKRQKQRQKQRQRDRNQNLRSFYLSCHQGSAAHAH